MAESDSERSQTPLTSNERDQLITALYLLKGQAQSPIHCETAGRAIHEIERLSRERDDAIAERIQETKEANRLRDAVTAGSARREVLRAVLGRFMDASCDGNLKVWAQEQLSGEPTSAPETSERCMHGRVVCEKCATLAINRHLAEIREIHDRHQQINKLLYGPGAQPGTMLGPMDSDAAHTDRGRLLSLLPIPPPSKAPETCDNEGEWVIVYADQDRLDEHFSGAGARAAAEGRFRQLTDSWTCRLFRCVAKTGYGPPQKATAGHPPAEVGPGPHIGQTYSRGEFERDQGFVRRCSRCGSELIRRPSTSVNGGYIVGCPKCDSV